MSSADSVNIYIYMCVCVCVCGTTDARRVQDRVKKPLTGRTLCRHAILVFRQSKKGTPYRINAMCMYSELCMSAFAQTF
jgi:hypothetical protein